MANLDPATLKRELMHHGRHTLEHFSANDGIKIQDMLPQLMLKKLKAGGHQAIDTYFGDFELNADALCLMIANDVCGYNDGNLTSIGNHNHVGEIAGLLGLSKTISDDHPLKSLATTMQEAMRKKYDELCPTPPRAKIDATTAISGGADKGAHYR